MCCGSITNYFPTWLGGKEGPNFKEVYLHKREKNGAFETDRNFPNTSLTLHYKQDVHTGELYKLTNNEPGDLRIKSFLITIAAVPYAGAVIIADFFRIIGAIASVACKAFVQLYRDYVRHGFCGATGEFFSNLGRGIRDEIWPFMREILMTPLALPILEAGAIFSLIFPEEGMLVIDFAQRFWFNATFHKDPRYRQKNPSDRDDTPSVCFLAYCMLSRGNIADQVEGPSGSGQTWNKFEETLIAQQDAPRTPTKKRINSGLASLTPAPASRSPSLDLTAHLNRLQFE